MCRAPCSTSRSLQGPCSGNGSGLTSSGWTNSWCWHANLCIKCMHTCRAPAGAPLYPFSVCEETSWAYLPSSQSLLLRRPPECIEQESVSAPTSCACSHHRLWQHLDASKTASRVFISWHRRSPTATAVHSDFLLHEVLAPSDADPSAGFSLHVADVVVQELLSACEDSPVPAPALEVRLGIFGIWPGCTFGTYSQFLMRLYRDLTCNLCSIRRRTSPTKHQVASRSSSSGSYPQNV